MNDQLENNNISLLNGIILSNNKDKINLSIDNIMAKYGSYDNYLNSIYTTIDNEFMDKYYPEHKDDIWFILLLNILNLIIYKI